MPIISRCLVSSWAFAALMGLLIFAVVTMVGSAYAGWNPGYPVLSTLVVVAWTIWDQYHPVPETTPLWYDK